MYKSIITALVTMLIITGCSGEGTQEETLEITTSKPFDVGATKENFTYETQGSINISIFLHQSSSETQKQILFYEEKRVENSPVGDLAIFDSLLMEGVIGSEGNYSAEITLGNHIDSIWVRIPALSYENELFIFNNEIVTKITQGS